MSMPVPPDSAASVPFPRPSGAAEEPSDLGPVLYFRGCQEDQLQLGAVLVCRTDAPRPVLSAADAPIAPVVLHRRLGWDVLGYEFSLPATGGVYRMADQRFAVAGFTAGDLRLAYVSCNGQERGDWERSLAERNTMWRRLAEQHQSEPLNLLLHGGDQLYADEMLDAAPAVRQWANGSADVNQEAPPEVHERLRDFLLTSYLKLYSQPAAAWLLARVPSLCMWDDHDICDGWGSLPDERLDSPIGRAVFEAAREFFLLFQFGCSSNGPPPPICSDPTGTTLTWTATLPGVRLIAPDLRSERRPERVLGPAGWTALEDALAAATEPRVIVLSSVPALGPRLSRVEAVLHLLPRAQKYEDDLRDQWQSRAHRDEWRRLLRGLLRVHERGGSPLTLISGEIHVATRCTMESAAGPLHQLIASGITHPPPTVWYARALGLLAQFGEAPLPEHRIRLHPLPGQTSIYTAQRNYLLLERQAGHWTARWELEQAGTTPPLAL